MSTEVRGCETAAVMGSARRRNWNVMAGRKE